MIIKNPLIYDNISHSTAPSIHIRNAYLTYNNTLIFDNLNFTIQPGIITCLLGPSGIGKTTLLQMIAGLTSTYESYVNGDINCDNNIALSQQLAYLPQQDTLLPWLNALDNTLLGSRLRGDNTTIAKQHAKVLFTQLGLTMIEHKFPKDLSGGMRQRIALIRTLLENKPIILMDEPFASVDAITRFQLQDLICNLLKNRTVVLVTHDPLEALRVADEIYIISGKPAKLNLFAKLTSHTPRNLSEPEVVTHQSLLFEALIKAKGMSI
jgi:putative hydroxymethylpyrimidine transport system ATP-binding protein